ncbi:MAG: hypothetical protein AAF467_08565 [Actinomycetota bacterium]
MTAANELILYATPTGWLADRCDAYFAEANAVGATTAQTYPPHCTLTGFFRRTPWRVAEIMAEAAAIIDANPQPGPGAVEIATLTASDSWVGFELTSPWLDGVIAAFAEGHRIEPDEDAIRPKSWLHLSLAYGVDDLTPYHRLTAGLENVVGRESTWEVALWERGPDLTWTRHTRST